MSASNPFAFPVSPEVWATHHDFCGMTLRDWFAGQAAGEAIDPYRTYGFELGRTNTDVQARYAYADAMLAEREKARAS